MPTKKQPVSLPQTKVRRFGEDGLWTITPDVAEVWLNHQGRNRTVKRHNLERLKRELLTGKWITNGDTIKFDVNSKLFDGQHRLLASVETQLPLVSHVVFGLPVDAQKTVDIGLRRSVGDMLHFLGEINTNNLAATLRWIWRYDHGKMLGYQGGDAPDIATLYDLLTAYPGIRATLPYGVLTQRLVTRSLGSALAHLMSRLDPEAADRFFAALADGENLTRQMPLYLLRNRLIANSQAKARLGKIEVAALVIKTWNATREGKPATTLKWQSGQAEAFPTLL